MTVYIATPYPMRDRAKELRAALADVGIRSTARWIVQDDSAVLSHDWAQADLDDVRVADALVALNPIEWSNLGTGGRHVELGAALILNKPVYLIGPQTNIFHYHNLVTVCETVSAACALLKARAA